MKKPPVLWVCIETDVDGRESICDSCQARLTAPMMLAAWPKNARNGRKYRLLRYEAVKPRGKGK